MKELKCSLCGWVSPRKKFQYKDINKHFEEAVAVWCPRNCCKEQYPRKVEKGYAKHWWYDYDGWTTIEKQPKILDIEHVRAVSRAREIRDRGIELLAQREKFVQMPKGEGGN